jgi:hypothetical protein
MPREAEHSWNIIRFSVSFRLERRIDFPMRETERRTWNQ